MDYCPAVYALVFCGPVAFVFFFDSVNVICCILVLPTRPDIFLFSACNNCCFWLIAIGTGNIVHYFDLAIIGYLSRERQRGRERRGGALALVYKLRVRLHVLQLQIVCTAYIKRAKSDIVQVTHIGADPSYPREREWYGKRPARSAG